MIVEVNFSYYIQIWNDWSIFFSNFPVFLLINTPENCQKITSISSNLYMIVEIYFNGRKKLSGHFLLDKTNKQTNIPLDLLYISNWLHHYIFHRRISFFHMFTVNYYTQTDQNVIVSMYESLDFFWYNKMLANFVLSKMKNTASHPKKKSIHRLV